MITYLAEVEKNLSNTISDFLMPSRGQEVRESPSKRQILIEQYLPNVLVDCKHDNAARRWFTNRIRFIRICSGASNTSDQGTSGHQLPAHLSRLSAPRQWRLA